MKHRNRRMLLGAAVFAPLLAVLVWFAATPANRCSVSQNLGFVYLAKGTLGSRSELATAQHWFTAALFDGCRDGGATFGLGQAYAGQGQNSAAIAALQAGQGREDLRRFLAGRVYENMGRADDAWSQYALLPRDAAARFYRQADQAEKAGDYEAALHDLAVATLINPAYPKAYYETAFIYWRRLGDRERAVNTIRQALAVDSKPSVERDFYQGLLCYYDDKTDCALAAWVEATREKTRVNPDSNQRYLAYEMMSRVLAQPRWLTLGQLALAGQGTSAP